MRTFSYGNVTNLFIVHEIQTTTMWSTRRTQLTNWTPWTIPHCIISKITWSNQAKSWNQLASGVGRHGIERSLRWAPELVNMTMKIIMSAHHYGSCILTLHAKEVKQHQFQSAPRYGNVMSLYPQRCLSTAIFWACFIILIRQMWQLRIMSRHHHGCCLLTQD